MDENAGGQNWCINQRRPLPASGSPLSSPSCSSTPTWLPVESPLWPLWRNDRPVDAGMQSSPPSCFYEELFCTSHTSNTLAPLASALITSSVPQSDVVKQGYLGKLERSHRRYFVLRAGSHTGPSRLEWYKSQEKFTALEKSAGKAALFDSRKQGLVKGDLPEVLSWCEPGWQFQKRPHGGAVCQGSDRGAGGGGPVGTRGVVWPVTVKPRGLGCSKSLMGESRLCLTATSLILVRVGACSDLPSVTIPLLSVRRFGHLDGSFFLELGRSAPNGPGEIWMEAREQGNPAAAQHIHEVVRETVRALRALPDFSRSPTNNHSQLQILLSSKRCRAKPRLLNVRPAGSRLALRPRNLEIQNSPTQCRLESRKPDQRERETTVSSTSRLSLPRSHQSSASETNSYVEMKMDHRGKENNLQSVTKVTGDHCGVAACGVRGTW
ncbi:insulin receptor substrate 2-like [Symphorus nematophorus]